MRGRAAAHGVSHVLLEAEAHISNTITRYQKGKHVMDEPRILPLRSPLAFTACKREEVLAARQSSLDASPVNLRFGAEVVAIDCAAGDFSIRLRDGEPVRAETVVLAIGVQGNPQTLGIPGEDLPVLQYQFDDPDEYEAEHIVVSIAGEYQDYIAAEQGVMAIGALTAAWNDVAPFDRDTARLIGDMMNALYDSVANDESFKRREFEAALRKIRTGLLN